MKKALMCLALLILSIVPTVANAHGDMDHILGTVGKIVGDTVTVTKDGKNTEIYLRDFTKYELAGQVSAREELRVGDRVVVHAKKKDNKEEAYDIRFMHTKEG